MKEKVYCNHCRYYKTPSARIHIQNPIVKSNPKYINTPIHIEKVYAYPKQKNTNNDCPDYKPKLIYKLKQYIKTNPKLTNGNSNTNLPKDY